ncbi:MAG: DNA-3-methyladenine glycosylase family protein [Pyrinomonadaceae bacterium]
MFETINKKNLAEICVLLSKSEPRFAKVIASHGIPPLWNRQPGFETLLRIILEQQVSLQSAAAAFNKLQERVHKISPAAVLAISDEELRACYFSRQKAAYAKELSTAVIEKRLNLKKLETMSDSDAKTELMKIKGIGNWTSDIYLLMAMLRTDIMPRGDIALHQAWADLSALDARPNADEFQIIAEKWKPFRSVAARILWHFYLETKASKPKIVNSRHH